MASPGFPILRTARSDRACDNTLQRRTLRVRRVPRRSAAGNSVFQRNPAKRHVAGFVLHDVRVHRGTQAVLAEIPDTLEGCQCQAFDQDLHGQVGHVPAAVGQRVLQQGAQTLVDRICEFKLFM